MKINSHYKIFLSLVSLIFFILLIMILRQYPIFKAFKTLKSSNAWLLFSILDFYVQVLAFSTIIVKNEGIIKAIPWILGNSILGSPIALIYLIYKF